MRPFTTFTGRVAFLDRANVDTDQIIPKQFLKRIERTGYGKFLFYDWRYLEGEQPDPAFELNDPKVAGAAILVSGENFGCGSSREHAVWALSDYGFRVLIAPSFADIFRSNCTKNGVLVVQLSAGLVAELLRRRERAPYELTVDLENQRLSDAFGWETRFEIAPFAKRMLLEGLDEIGLTLKKADKIAAYEQKARVPGQRLPADRQDPSPR